MNWTPPRRTVLASALVLLGCMETTGSDLVSFSAAAAGPSDATVDSPLSFATPAGFSVTLTRARLHIGAVYFNRSVPTSGSQPTSCVAQGIYVAEVTEPADIDVLSPDPQPLVSQGHGTAEHARSAEVWLTGSDVNALDDTTVIVDVAGTAEKDDARFPFEAQITIGKNRSIPPGDPALPGVNPLCKQRIVSPIPVDITFSDGGALLLRIDPRAWFLNVDFSQLGQVASDPPLYRFEDSSEDTPERALYDGVRSRLGVFDFQWTNQ